jgi:EpsD family peptidyl-prolyl cis-trans isomerase
MFGNQNSNFRIGAVAIGLGSLVFLVGCNRHNAADESAAPAGQVIAHVGSDPITVEELDNELRLANVPLDKRTDAIVKHTLTELIVRKYLVQQALAGKLDSDPTVRLEILRSREQALAGAQVQLTVASKASSSGEADVAQFIAVHPAQFGKRQILKVDEIALPTNQATQSLIDATKDFKTLEQVDQKLTDLGISHSRSTGVLDSGNLPDDFLTAVQRKREDDIFFVRTGASGTFFKVIGEQSLPLTGDEAATRASQLIRLGILRAETEQAAKAAIATARYEGVYAEIMSKPPADNQGAPAKN